jgi:hypothetical protein
MNRSVLARALTGAVLFLALGGPAPGAVGSCGGELSSVDPVQFCANRRVAECNRGRARAMLDPAPLPCTDDPATPTDEADPLICSWSYCLSLVPTRCMAANFDDCSPPPSEGTANACLSALLDPARLAEATADIPECNPEFICPSSGGLTESLDAESLDEGERGAAETESAASPSEPSEVP